MNHKIFKVVIIFIIDGVVGVGKELRKTVTVSLAPEHIKWLDDECLNVSKWFRRKIDEEMKNEQSK